MVGVLYLIYYFAIYLWYIYLILGGVFLLLARRWLLATTSPGGKLGSSILIFIGGLILILGIYGTYVWINERMMFKNHKKSQLQTWVLEEDTEVAGLPLPKGSEIKLRETFDMNLKEQATLNDIWWMTLSEPTSLFGLVFDYGWKIYLREIKVEGHLLGTQYVKGLPLSEKIWLTKEGIVIKAHIAYDIVVNGQPVDKGTIIYSGAENDSQKEYIRVEHPEQAFDPYQIELRNKIENTIIKR